MERQEIRMKIDDNIKAKYSDKQLRMMLSTINDLYLKKLPTLYIPYDHPKLVKDVPRKSVSIKQMSQSIRHLIGFVKPGIKYTVWRLINMAGEVVYVYVDTVNPSTTVGNGNNSLIKLCMFDEQTDSAYLISIGANPYMDILTINCIFKFQHYFNNKGKSIVRMESLINQPILYGDGRIMKDNTFDQRGKDVDAVSLLLAKIAEYLNISELRWDETIDPKTCALAPHSKIESIIFYSIVTNFFVPNVGEREAAACNTLLSKVNKGYLSSKLNIPDNKITEYVGGIEAYVLSRSVTSSSDDDIRNPEIPYLKLTDKEWDYINKYTEKTALLSSDIEPWDLKKLIEEVQYGSVFQGHYKTNIGNGFDYSIKELYNDELDILSIVIIIHIKENCKYIASCSFADPTHFNIINNIVACTGTLCNILTSWEALAMVDDIAKGPDLLSDEFIKYMVFEYISLMITMRDRPQRTRVIRETETRTERNPRSGETVEKDYVIRRILRPAKEAKEYVKNMTGSSHTIHHYVIESWTRRAHERHLKNGTIIHIGECTCQRHQPLSQKEIHIKL